MSLIFSGIEVLFFCFFCFFFSRKDEELFQINLFELTKID